MNLLHHSSLTVLQHCVQASAAELSSAPRSFHIGGADKVSIKAQVVFDTCWRKLEEGLKAVGKVRQGLGSRVGRPHCDGLCTLQVSCPAFRGKRCLTPAGASWRRVSKPPAG